MLLKGPIIFLPVGGTILWMTVRERSFAGIRRLGLGWGLVWFALLVAPWFVAIGVKSDGAFFQAALGEDLAGKLAQRREGASLPPGFHLLSFFGTFWPFAPLALLAVPYVWRWRRAPETAFLLGWILPAWIVFELVATKLLHYTLPTYPAIAGLAAVAALDGSEQPKGPLFWAAAALFALPALALPLGLGVALPIVSEGQIFLWPALGAVAALVALVAAWRWFVHGLWLGFARAALIGAGILYATAYGAALPSLSQIWIGQRLVDVAAPFRACLGPAPGGVPFASVRFHEPSLVFLAGTKTALLNPEEAARALSTGAVDLVWVARRLNLNPSLESHQARFERAVAGLGQPVERLAATTGFQYNGGRPLGLTLYARAGDPRLRGCVADRG